MGSWRYSGLLILVVLGSGLPSRAEEPPIVFASRDFAAGGDPRALPGAVRRAERGRLLLGHPRDGVRALVDATAAEAPARAPEDVADPCVSWDAAKVLFAGFSRAESGWRIYEVGLDGSGLRQLTGGAWDRDLTRYGSAARLLEGYDDLDPCYLSDGRICFVSTRHPGVAPPDRTRVTNLYVADPDGGAIHRITTERFGADTPVVEPVTGRIVYSRWWRSLGAEVRTTGIPEPEARGNGPPAPDVPQPPPYYGPPPAPPGATVVNGEALISDEVHRGIADEDFPGVNCWSLAAIHPDGTGLEMYAGLRLDRQATMAYRPSFLPSGEVLALFLHEAAFLGLPGRSGLRRLSRGAGKPVALGGPQTFAGLQGFTGMTYASAEALPDGRALVTASAAPAGGRTPFDYDVYVQEGASSPRLLFGYPGTAEVDAVPVVGRLAPNTMIEHPREPLVEDAPATVAEAYARGSFRFVAENIHFNGPVDMPIAGAPPVGRPLTIELYMAPQRTRGFPADPGLLLAAMPVGADGRVEAELPAGVPLFEVLRRPDGKIALGRDGQIYHVSGLNFGTPGTVARCVGCHAGHSLLAVPDDPSWTNLAPSARVTASSTRLGSPGLFEAKALVDRRTDPIIGEWAAETRERETTVTLRWDSPLRVREVKVYGTAPGSGMLGRRDQTIKSLAIETFRAPWPAESKSVYRPILPEGTAVPMDLEQVVDTLVLTIYHHGVDGRYEGKDAPALAEVEVTAKAVGEPSRVVRILRGDADCDARLGLSDAVSILGGLFQGSGPPCCQEAGDVNRDLSVDLGDAVHLLNHLFRGGPPPVSARGAADCAGAEEGAFACERPACP